MMWTFKIRWVGVWLLLTVLCAVLPVPHLSQAYAVPDGSPANGRLVTVDVGGNIIQCSAATDSAGNALGAGALLGKIVPCLTYTIEGATVRFAAEMVDRFRPLLYSFLAVVIVLFGVRVLQNEPKIYMHGFVLVFKLTIVLAVLNDLGGTRSINDVAGSGDIIPAVYQIMTESQEIVVGAIDATSIACDVDTYDNGQDIRLWSTLDCLMGKLFGYTVGTDGNGSMLLASSIVGLLAGFAFGGGWGIVIFFAMVGVLFGIFMLVVRTVVIFISSYLLICLMLILAPLLMPLVFLRATERYFQAFWKNILGSFLTPIILTTYVMFALLIYDRMLFDSDSIVQRLFDWDVVVEAMDSTRMQSGAAITVKNYDARLGDNANTPASQQQLMRSPMLQNLVMNTLSGAGVAGIKVPNLDISKMGDEFDRGKETIEGMFTELVSLCILAWLINQGLGVVTKLMPLLTAVSVPTKAMKEVQSFEDQAMTAGKGTMNAMKNEANIANKEGREFLSSVRGSAEAGVRKMDDYMKAMQKK